MIYQSWSVSYDFVCMNLRRNDDSNDRANMHIIKYRLLSIVGDKTWFSCI